MSSRGDRLRLVTIVGPASAEDTFIEVWLLTVSKGAVVGRQLLIKDGHRDAQVARNYADDPLQVKNGKLVYTHKWPGISGRWRGSLTETFTLDAPRLTGIEWWSWDAFDANKDAARTIETIDLASLRGATTTKGTACGAKIDVAAAYVPSVDSAALREHWRTTSIAACAAVIDGAASGYTLEGAAKPKDTSFAIAGTDRQLIVEVLDDDVRPPTADGIGDELELLQSPSYAGLGTLCEEAPAPARYRIQVTTGIVTLVSGPVGTIRPEVEVAGGSNHRLHITLGENVISWALAYRDTDDGNTAERVVSTARIRTGAVAELGLLSREAPVRCELRDGALRREWPHDPTTALSVGYGP